MTEENKPGTKRGKSTQEIEAEIGETRNALTGDIKALREKVSPAHLKQEAKTAIRDAKDSALEKAAEVATEVKDAVVEKASELKDLVVEKAADVKEVTLEKAHVAAEAISTTVEEVGAQARRAGSATWGFTVDNAVPLTLIGVGAGWLIANQRRERSSRDDSAQYDSARPRAGRPLASTYPAASMRRGDNGDSSANMGARMARSAQGIYEKAADTLGGAEQAVVGAAARGRDIVQEKLTQAGQASREFAHDNPLALALGTLALGIGVGLLLPSSARENALLGPSRDKLNRTLGEARGAAREFGSMARDTARDTANALTNLESNVH